MVHGSLFSGIGGFDLAAGWMGWNNAFHCEIDGFCNKILNYWFPDAKSFTDITKTDFSGWRGKVNILTGGFPCQPFSVAGQRKGADDNRYLWPQMLRAVREIRPDWIVGENVGGILSMVQPGEEVEVANGNSIFGEDYCKRVLLRQEYVVETICRNLECEGYSVQPFLIPACAVGAPHRRDRIWFVARRNSGGNDSHTEGSVPGGGCRKKPSPDTDGVRCNGRVDPVREGLLLYNGQGHTKKDQPERDGRKYRAGKVCETPPDTQCFGSDQIYPQVQSRKPDGNGINRNGNEQSASDAAGEQNKRMRPVQPQDCGQEQGKPRRGNCEGHSVLRDGRYIEGVWKDFPAQPPVCRRNDGLPFNVDGLAVPFTQWRTESVKAYGNAIVPQVAFEIFKAINLTYNLYKDEEKSE